jgi:Holliday junction resolvase
MTEQQIQSKIIKRLESQGFFVIKLIKTSKNGIPDLLALKDGKAKFIEVKKPAVGIVSEIQKYRIKELEKYGFETSILSSEQGIS